MFIHNDNNKAAISLLVDNVIVGIVKLLISDDYLVLQGHFTLKVDENHIECSKNSFKLVYLPQ